MDVNLNFFPTFLPQLMMIPHVNYPVVKQELFGTAYVLPSFCCREEFSWVTISYMLWLI